MARSANPVAIILNPGQRFIDLSHLAAVPGGDTIKESYAPLVRAVIQPLSVILDLMSLARKMSQSLFDFHPPASQPGCVRWLNTVLHRSNLLPLTGSSIKKIFEIISIVGISNGPRESVVRCRKMVHNCDDKFGRRKKNASSGRFTCLRIPWGFRCSRFGLVPDMRFYLNEVATLIHHPEPS